MSKEKSYREYLFGLSDDRRESLLQKLREIEEIELLEERARERGKPTEITVDLKCTHALGDIKISG